MNKIFLIGIFMLFLIGFVAAMGDETMISHTGDREGVIGLLGDEIIGFAGDFIAPKPTINSPSLNVEYTNPNIFFNVTTDEDSKCNYSLNSGTTNFTMATSGNSKDFIAVRSLKNGKYTARFYCYDNFGNLNDTRSISFLVNVASPIEISSGNGGGGGSIAIHPKNTTFAMDTTKFIIRSVVGDKSVREFTIKNMGNKSTNIALRIEGQKITMTDGTVKNFNKFATLSLNHTKLKPGEKTIVKLHIIAPDVLGVFSGKILLTDGNTNKQIFIAINTQSKETIFDVSDTVINNKIYNSEKVRTQIDLLPVGEKGVDITLKYTIKDFNGKIYLEKSETFYVKGPMSFVREFPTKNLSPNNYLVTVQMIYLGGFASASSQFEVVGGHIRRFDWDNESIILAGLFAIILAGIILWLKLNKIQEYKKL